VGGRKKEQNRNGIKFGSEKQETQNKLTKKKEWKDHFRGTKYIIISKVSCFHILSIFIFFDSGDEPKIFNHNIFFLFFPIETMQRKVHFK
jgi:hypothetical protein